MSAQMPSCPERGAHMRRGFSDEVMFVKAGWEGASRGDET